MALFMVRLMRATKGSDEMAIFLPVVIVMLTAFAPGTDACAEDDASAKDRTAQEAILRELKTVPHKILFETYVNNNWEIFVMNANGSGRHNLTNSADDHELYPQASPDGTKICYLRDTKEKGRKLRNVYLMNSDGSARTLVAERARQPCWSPDSKRVAFVKQEFNRFNIKDFSSKGLFFYEVATGKTTPHRNNGNLDENKKILHLYNPTWSNDGDWIVSTVHAGMGYGHAIIAIEVDGDRVINLGIDGCRPTLNPEGNRVTWSPDDHTISVAEIDFTGSEPKVSATRILDQREIEHTYHPDFSPDGLYVTYSVGPGGRTVASGPGTHTEVSEMVGVRGDWQIHLKRVSGEGPSIELLNPDLETNKESDWLPIFSPELGAAE
jgi:hypothetical protein